MVDTKLTKKQIKNIIENLYKIQIISIQTTRLPIKRKRFSKFEGYKKFSKKAIIRIKPEQSIQILPNQST